MAEEKDKAIPVRVALRIRPFLQKELDEGCAPCIETIKDCPQVQIKGSGEAFTFDYVFDGSSKQETVYYTAAASLIEKIFKGYNVTILAYGQTGSGKTHSMGTADFTYSSVQESSGIIPRAITDIFSSMSKYSDIKFGVKVSFLELYKEQLFDLLSPKPRSEAIIEIREDARGIKLPGLSEIVVTSPSEALSCLESGSKGRQIGATAMNDKSSRSHAVFTLTVDQWKDNALFMSSQFHMVDLAGSERVAKTKATGNRFQEGIKINAGLLALGNVICKLGAGDSKHISYRDSKLTRLLQDSLGGNSYTLMIACVGPADYNMDETISTIRYADRARKIKNKPIKNQDPIQMELDTLKKQVKTLEYQLENCGKGTTNYENTTETMQLRERIRHLENENGSLSTALSSAIEQSTINEEKLIFLENANTELKKRLEELQNMANVTYEVLNKTVDITHEAKQPLVKHMEEVKAHISLIQQENVNREECLLNLEIDMSRASNAGVITEQSGNVVESNAEEKEEILPFDEDAVNDEETEVKEETNRNVLERAKMSRQIESLQRNIVEKEDTVRRLVACTALQVDIEHVQSLESQVANLQKEREALVKQLEQAQANPSLNKLSEQRRKRMEELERQISDMKKKIVEQNKILAQKRRIEADLSKLTSQIQDLKSTRVKLIRQLREDSAKFSQWKKQKDHELMQMRERERKREGERIRQNRIQSRKETVMKRRLEDAIAVSKRFKDALDQLRCSKKPKNPTIKSEEQVERIKFLIERDVNYEFSLKQANKITEAMIQERKELAKEKAALKKRMGSASMQEKKTLQEKLNDLQNNLDMRSGQILEIQKLAAIDPESKGKNAWDSLSTVNEMKIAMKLLFDGFLDSKDEASSKDAELKDIKAEMAKLQSDYEKAISNTERYSRDICQLQEKHEQELKAKQKELEEQVLTLMTQTPYCDSSVSTLHGDVSQKLTEKLQCQEAELLKMKELEKELAEKKNEIEQLQNELTYLKEFHKTPEKSANSSKQKKKVKTGDKICTPRYTIAEFFNSSQDSIDSGDETEDDPEWQKTPGYKRVKAITSRFRTDNSTSIKATIKFEDSGEGSMEASVGVSKPKKRQSLSNCRCTSGACANCLCVKEKRPCDEKCKCSVIMKCGNSFGHVTLNKENIDSQNGETSNNEQINEDFVSPKKRRTGSYSN
ncbi:chromosome-associated kinesin KIF4A-like isoform X2 [Artemia franciscana]